MFGSIMPEPLHMPPTVTVRPPIFTCTAACFGFVSVVITAFSAARPASGVAARFAAADFMPASRRSIGRGWPITPVEATSTSFGSMPSVFAVSSALRRASARPCAPVQAFAQPLFARMAWMRPPRTAARSYSTGAAATAFVVNTAAAAQGASATTSATSLRPLYLISAGTPAARNPLAAQTPPSMILTFICSSRGIIPQPPFQGQTAERFHRTSS